MAIDLDRAFAALGDPTRRAILARLAAGDATVNELAAPFGFAQPTISRHLKILEDAGLIDQRRDAQRRPRRLRPEALTAVEAWTRQLRAQWDARLDNLERHLAAIQGKEE